jgi:hypothetical protein
MKKFLIFSILILVLLNIFVHMSCQKEEPLCRRDDCPGMLSCHDNICSCAPDDIAIGTTTCVQPIGFNRTYLADGTAGDMLREKTVIFFHEIPDTIRSNNPNTGVNAGLTIAYEGARFHPMENYLKFDLNPDGIVGDAFYYTLYERRRLTSTPSDGYCYVNIQGTWTHPDTIAAKVRLISCVPYDVPEADNMYRVKFIKVKK